MIFVAGCASVATSTFFLPGKFDSSPRVSHSTSPLCTFTVPLFVHARLNRIGTPICVCEFFCHSPLFSGPFDDEDFAQEPEGALKGDANPGPTAELEFWENKSGNLNLIHQQLNDEKVRRVMRVLEVTKSTYFPAFNRLCKEVAQARMEVFAGIFWLDLLCSFSPHGWHT